MDCNYCAEFRNYLVSIGLNDPIALAVIGQGYNSFYDFDLDEDVVKYMCMATILELQWDKTMKIVCNNLHFTSSIAVAPSKLSFQQLQHTVVSVNCGHIISMFKKVISNGSEDYLDGYTKVCEMLKDMDA